MDQLSITGIEPAPQNVKRKRDVQTTRGYYYGIKASVLARDAKIKIAKIRVKISRLQEPWAESDPMIEEAVARAVAALDELTKQFTDSAAYMNEPMND
jgi:hypothetical protein